MANQKYADPVVPIAPMCMVLGISVLVDIPELGLLAGVLMAALPAAYKEKASRWWQQMAGSKKLEAATAALCSTPPTYLLGASLSLAVAFGQVQTAMAIATAGAYLAFNELNKTQRRRVPCKVETSPKVKAMQEATTMSSWRKTPFQRHQQDRIMRSDSNRVAKPAPARSVQGASEGRSSDKGIDGEIQDLVNMCTPARQDETAMRRLVQMTKRCIFRLIPEAEVSCVPQGNFELIAATGEKPEVNVVVTCDREILTERLTQYFLNGQSRIKKSLDTLAPEMVQKTATKTLSERLTFVKFWRSQFSGPEPMVVLLVPDNLGLCNCALRMNFTVNTHYVLRLKTVMSKECTVAKEVIMLTTSWARARCLTNVSRGLPHTYAWGVFVMDFFRSQQLEGTTEKVSKLFDDFLAHCSQLFSRNNAAMSVSFSGEVPEQTPEAKLWGIPYIQDPFDTAANLGETLTADGVKRVREEIDRAREILSQEVDRRLSKLLERWVPPSDVAPNRDSIAA